ncbi:MAG: hypothetical protein OXI90_15455 [Gammaproteobacteria bacterium]|nr:hypothetical protein [Gammaproteobacteria bacterium]
MRQSRRDKLAEEALAEIEWSELGLTTTVRSGLTEADEGAQYGDRSLHFFAYSYSEAFKLLWDHASSRQSLVYPMLHACRHSIELWLKAAISAVSERDPPPGHRILELWNKLMGAFHGGPTESVNDVFATLVWPIISEFEQHDGSGDRFRYPSDRRFQEYPSTEAYLDDLFRAHWLITTYCDAVCSQMEAERDSW